MTPLQFRRYIVIRGKQREMFHTACQKTSRTRSNSVGPNLQPDVFRCNKLPATRPSALFFPVAGAKRASRSSPRPVDQKEWPTARPACPPDIQYDFRFDHHKFRPSASIHEVYKTL